tara:strand:- start:4129 stop:4833 length:705 start_codon:yes stop_codon:yes gene_type:complete
MENNFDIQTYLYLDSKKLSISVYDDLFNQIYTEDFLFDEKLKNFSLDDLDFFLNKNIFKIEKNLNNFVKKIIVIIKTDEFFKIDISVKKNSYEDSNSNTSLKYLLNEAKDCCKKTVEEKKILHMIIESYKLDNQHFSYLPKNKNTKNFSIDIKFICLSLHIIKNLENILKKYQISLGQILCANYILDFFESTNDRDIFKMAKKMMDGYNPNEVLLTLKTNKKQGFFEKFFNFFS